MVNRAQAPGDRSRLSDDTHPPAPELFEGTVVRDYRGSYSRYLDLNNPTPELANNPPTMPYRARA